MKKNISNSSAHIRKRFEQGTLEYYLATFPACRDLNEKSILKLSKYCVLQLVPAEQFVFMQGDTAQDYLWLISGKVKLCFEGASVKTSSSAFEILGGGDLIHDPAMLDEEPHSFSAFALSDVVVLKISAPDYLDKFLSIPDIARSSCSALGQYAWRAQRGKLISAEPVETRIATLLWDLAERHGIPSAGGKGIRIDVPQTRREIAEMTQTTVETTIRITGRWFKERWLSIDNRYFVIHDMSRLKRLIFSFQPNDKIQTGDR